MDICLLTLGGTKSAQHHLEALLLQTCLPAILDAWLGAACAALAGPKAGLICQQAVLIHVSILGLSLPDLVPAVTGLPMGQPTRNYSAQARAQNLAAHGRPYRLAGSADMATLSSWGLTVQPG